LAKIDEIYNSVNALFEPIV